MEAMGGRKAWDETRYLSASCRSRRTHCPGQVDRNPGTHQWHYAIAWANINTKEGAEKDGQKVADELEQAKLMKGYEAWVNDSYWLFMPYKLKDSGVLKYKSEGATDHRAG